MSRQHFAIYSLSCFLAVALSSPSADARERRSARSQAPKSGHVERSVTRTGSDGTARTSSHDTSWQRGNGQWSRDTVHTGPNGKQGSTHVEGAKTDDGYVRDATRTRPDGRSATTHDELHRSENGYTRETVHTGPKGGVTTRDATGSYDAEAKTWTRDATTTRPNGSSTSTQVIRQVTPVTDSAPSPQ